MLDSPQPRYSPSMPNKLVKTTDLQQDGLHASQRNIPLMIMFSQEDCAFCLKLTEEIINPMLISGDYTDRVLIRELMIDSGMDIIDFSGKPVNPRELFNRYRLFVTPSVLILDSSGKELAERQIGINTVDYYGYYLDQAIDKALVEIRNRTS
jgi:thioredoxin-related protein